MRLPWRRRAPLVPQAHADELRAAIAPKGGEGDDDYMGRLVALFGTAEDVAVHEQCRAIEAEMEAWLAANEPRPKTTKGQP